MQIINTKRVSVLNIDEYISDFSCISGCTISHNILSALRSLSIGGSWNGIGTVYEESADRIS